MKEPSVFRLVTIVPAVCLAMALAPDPGNAFIGRWKLEGNRSRLPDQMNVQNKGDGRYAFVFGGDVETIAVDGTDQPGAGGTSLSIKAETANTWIVQRKRDGRLLLRATWVLSKDGRTLTDHYRELESDGSARSMEYIYRRTGQGSGFAGDWRSVKETMVSPFYLDVTAFDSDGLSLAYLTDRRTKNMKFDGGDYPQSGPNAAPNASSAVRRLDARTLVITDKADGKVTATEDVVLSHDRNTLTITQHVIGREKPNVMVFHRVSPRR